MFLKYKTQIPSYGYETVSRAVDWIWGGSKVESRQGDVGIASTKLKNKTGEEKEIRIIDSHFFIGEVYQNGSIHVRHGFLYHEKNQHPAIYVGSEWKRIVIAKRSQKNLSSRD